jgi:hypothetical protein
MPFRKAIMGRKERDARKLLGCGLSGGSEALLLFDKAIREHEITSKGALSLGRRLTNYLALISGIPVYEDRVAPTGESSQETGIESKS